MFYVGAASLGPEAREADEPTPGLGREGCPDLLASR